MFKYVPELDVDTTVEIGDVKSRINTSWSTPREMTGYIVRGRRMFVNRTKDEERKLAMGFFLPRMSFLNHREIIQLFQCIDTVKDVCITKKNNVIVAPYVILATMSAKGYRLTETLLELFFPELHKERSKKFRFSTQIQLVQEKLGYPPTSYYIFEFEYYYSTVCLIIQSYHGERTTTEPFDTRSVSDIIKSLAEITYRLYVLHIRSSSVQWSVSTKSIINQIINTVIGTIYILLSRAIADGSIITCTLSIDTLFPFQQLKHYYSSLERLVTDMKKMQSCKMNRHYQRVLLSYCSLSCSVNSPGGFSSQIQQTQSHD